MRRYHIYFEPFVDKIRVNQYIGLDMSFYSELFPVESLTKSSKNSPTSKQSESGGMNCS